MTICNDDGCLTLRCDSLENWNKVNPTLSQGELVIVEHNGKYMLKAGNGSNDFKTLGFVGGGYRETLERNKAYKVGDIAHCAQLPDGWYLQCEQAGTTGETEPTFNTGGNTSDGSCIFSIRKIVDREYTDNTYLHYSGGNMQGYIVTNLGCYVGGSKELGTGITLDECIERCRYGNGCYGSVNIQNDSRIPSNWYHYIYIPHRHGGNGYNQPESDNHNYGSLLLFNLFGNQIWYNVVFHSGYINVYSHS